MMDKGYSWIVTDGVTGVHHLLEQENRIFPDYLDGLIGTMPKSTAGPAFRKFAQLYAQNFTKDRLADSGFLLWNPSSLTVSSKIYIALEILASYFNLRRALVLKQSYCYELSNINNTEPERYET